jgi:hypothetical protein
MLTFYTARRWGARVTMLLYLPSCSSWRRHRAVCEAIRRCTLSRDPCLKRWGCPSGWCLGLLDRRAWRCHWKGCRVMRARYPWLCGVMRWQAPLRSSAPLSNAVKVGALALLQRSLSSIPQDNPPPMALFAQWAKSLRCQAQATSSLAMSASLWTSAPARTLCAWVRALVTSRVVGFTLAPGVVEDIHAVVQALCINRGLTCRVQRKVSFGPPATSTIVLTQQSPQHGAAGLACSPLLQTALKAAVGPINARYNASAAVPVLVSGAGHDGLAMAAACPVGMLFVRCRGGISHNPAEFVEADDVAAAVEALLAFLRADDDAAAGQLSLVKEDL